MKQKDLCNKIGIADRSFRRLSPAKRKQWQALANKGRTVAFYDVLAQLCFEVDAFNASADTYGMNISMCKSVVTLYQFDNLCCVEKSFYIYSDEELTQALQYVQSLNK